jgi:hypothetical protein
MLKTFSFKIRVAKVMQKNGTQNIWKHFFQMTNFAHTYLTAVDATGVFGYDKLS